MIVSGLLDNILKWQWSIRLSHAQRNELEMAGLDPFELEWMDEEERRERIEDVGLDPDDYEFV